MKKLSVDTISAITERMLKIRGPEDYDVLWDAKLSAQRALKAIQENDLESTVFYAIQAEGEHAVYQDSKGKIRGGPFEGFMTPKGVNIYREAAEKAAEKWGITEYKKDPIEVLFFM